MGGLTVHHFQDVTIPYLKILLDYRPGLVLEFLPVGVGGPLQHVAGPVLSDDLALRPPGVTSACDAVT